MMDAGDGTVLTLSGFGDQAAAARSSEAAAGWVKENLADQVPDPPQVTTGTVHCSKVGA
jgi:hypothetical protein